MAVLVCIPTNSVRGFPFLLSRYFIGCSSGLGRFQPWLLPPTLPDVYSLMVHHWKVYGKVKRRKHFHTLHWGIFAVHQLYEGNPTTTTCPEKLEDLFTHDSSGHPETAQAQSRKRSHRRSRAAGKSSQQRGSDGAEEAEREVRSRPQAHCGPAGRLQGGHVRGPQEARAGQGRGAGNPGALSLLTDAGQPWLNRPISLPRGTTQAHGHGCVRGPVNPHREALRPNELFHMRARPRSGGRSVLTSEPGTAAGGHAHGEPGFLTGVGVLTLRSVLIAPRLPSDRPGHPPLGALDASTPWPSGSSGAASFAQASGVRRVPRFSFQLPPSTGVSSPAEQTGLR